MKKMYEIEYVETLTFLDQVMAENEEEAKKLFENRVLSGIISNDDAIVEEYNVFENGVSQNE